jgi:DNA polymerase-3 subunit delta'
MIDIIQQRLKSDLSLNKLYNSYLIQTEDYDIAHTSLNDFIKTDLLNIPSTENSHPDFIVIKKESITVKGISVDQIRYLQKFLYKTSVISGKKIALIIGADQMNLNAANSCLKILEDTPLNSYLFLVTKNAASILPTIRSRCSKINLINHKGELPIDEKYLYPLLKSFPLKDKLAFIREFSSKDRDLWSNFVAAVEMLLCRQIKKAINCKIELSEIENNILLQFQSNSPEYLLYKFEKVKKLAHDTINFDLELQASSLLMIDNFKC